MNIPTIALGLVLALSPAAALAQSAAPMALGSPAPPPAGYLELCQRNPGQCLETRDASPEQMAAVSHWAAQAQWDAVFQPMLSASAAALARRDSGQAFPPVAGVLGDLATGSTILVDKRTRPKPGSKAATVGLEAEGRRHLGSAGAKRDGAKALTCP